MSNTTNLSLFKHDNPSTNTNAFDIERALNENWDKVDTYAGNTNTTLSNKVDKVTGKGLSTNDFTTEYKNQVDTNQADITNIKAEQITQNTNIQGKVDKVTGKGLSTNDYSTAEKTKLNGIASGAQVNVIENVKVNGTSQTITNKAVNISVPTKTSQLQNDSNYGTYTKPNSGIPKTDLAQAVQTSLEKADSALQQHQDISGKEDKTNKVTELNENSTNTQYPSAKAVYDELVALEEENEALRNDLNNSTLTIPGNGEDVTLANTAEARFKKLEVQGNSKQETTSTEQGDEYDSPSPEHPSEVQTKKGNANVVVCNKNIVTWTYYNSPSSDYQVMVVAEYHLKKGKKYIVSFDTPNTGARAYTQSTSGTSNLGYTTTYKQFALDGVRKSYVITATETGTFRSNAGMLLSLNTSGNPTGYISNLMIESINDENEEATEYTPHEHQNYVLPIQKDMLEGDYFDWKNNKEIHHWEKIASYNGETITTEYKSSTGELSTGATVYYRLTDPLKLNFTQTQKTIANQIEKTAHSYNDITHIYSTDELSPIFDVQAMGDLNAILANQNQENS